MKLRPSPQHRLAMHAKEVVSHNIGAQNGVQAKSNSCYFKQNNPASFQTKNTWGLSSFFWGIPWNPMLSLPSVVSVLIPPASQGLCNTVFHPPGKRQHYPLPGCCFCSFSVRSEMSTLCWEQARPGNTHSERVLLLQGQKPAKSHSDSGPIQLWSKWNYMGCNMQWLSV